MSNRSSTLGIPSDKQRQLAARLRVVVAKIGTQPEAAKVSGTSLRSIEQYLSGKVAPPIRVLMALADETGTSLEWIVNGTVPKSEIDNSSPVDMRATDILSARSILDVASDTIETRRGSYGTTRDGLVCAAQLWSIILGREVQAYQVALCLDALKTSRLVANPTHLDSWVDKAGYSAIGGEVAGARKESAP